ncbi:MAG: Crp/Fnr family transcriptional regulator [Lutispora sp.]|jgi:CRP-like cAMP-binding protein|uniref:Crp/Fnr family transcriptional regulator n=1 Tax=Lutispora sp. TaxID=2828727 RepID=UPI0035654ED6
MIIKEYSYIFKANALFSNLIDEEIRELLNDNNHKISKYRKGSIIYLQNEKCKTLDLVLYGSVIVQSITEDGNSLTVSDFTKGDIIGLNLMFSQKSFYPMTISAKSDCTMLHIKKETILDLAMKNKNFLAILLQYLSDRSIFLTDKIKLISGKSIRQLILDFLAFECQIQGSSRIKLNMTKKELAERFGIQRTSLSRELQKMRKEGLVDYGRDWIMMCQARQLDD